MDDIVLRGMAKWPDVPAVFGWLALDRRGNWLLRGEPIANPALTEFIGRNYDCDDRGRWFFQNGPQRVYVALEYTPFVYRVICGSGESWSLKTHDGRTTHSVLGAWLDEHGNVLIETEAGIGVVHDRDLELLITAFVDRGGARLSEDELERRLASVRRGAEANLFLEFGSRLIGLQSIASERVAEQFAFDPSPVKRD